MATHITELTKQQIEGADKTDGRQQALNWLPALREAAKKRCEEDHWSERARLCILRAHDEVELETCAVTTPRTGAAADGGAPNP